MEKFIEFFSSYNMALLLLISHERTAALFFLRFISSHEVDLFRLHWWLYRSGLYINKTGLVIGLDHAAIFSRLSILLSTAFSNKVI